MNALAKLPAGIITFTFCNDGVNKVENCKQPWSISILGNIKRTIDAGNYIN